MMLRVGMVQVGVWKLLQQVIKWPVKLTLSSSPFSAIDLPGKCLCLLHVAVNVYGLYTNVRLYVNTAHFCTAFFVHAPLHLMAELQNDQCCQLMH